MRPVPRSRHLLAVAMFVIVSAAFTYMAHQEVRLSADQVRHAAAALKLRQGELFPSDALLGPSGAWRREEPAFRWLLAGVLAAPGLHQPVAALRAMVAPVTLLYLCGMYLLLYRQCRSWSVAAFVAVLSAAAVSTPGPATWGAGALEFLTPAGLWVAVVPFLLVAYLAWEKRRLVLLAFLLVGLTASLHRAGATNLAAVLLIVYLLRGRLRLRCWLTAVACAAACAVGMAPSIWRQAQLGAAGGGGPGFETAAAMLRLSRMQVFRADFAGPLLSWGLLVLVLLIPSAVVLVRLERFRARNACFWLVLGLAAVLVAFGLHSVSVLGGVLLDRPPVVAGFVRASCLVMPAVYVLLAQALTGLFRLVGGRRGLVRWGCAVLMAAWMLPSDNARPARHAALEAATAYMPESEKPEAVQRHRDRHEAAVELAAIAEWARSRTDRRSVFAVNSAEFRMRSRRSVVAASSDARSLLGGPAESVTGWREQAKRQHALLVSAGAGDAEGIKAFLDGLGRRERFAGVTGWFVVLRAGVALERAGAFEPIPSANWGDAFRLYRKR